MDLAAPAIVVAVRPHGEHGVVVRALTQVQGMVAAYVPGGRSRANRPVLQPGNGVALRWRARREGSLPTASVELTASRTALATDRRTAAGLDWLTALVATVLDEGVPFPRLYAALDGVLTAMALAEPATWLAALVRFELLLLNDLGFGLDLTSCVATGAPARTADLAYVSPKSSQAVGRAAGEPYAAKLLPLPAFLVTGDPATAAEVGAAMRTTGWFLERDVLTGTATALRATRERLAIMTATAGGAAGGDAATGAVE